MPLSKMYDTWYVPRIGKGIGQVLRSTMTPQEENFGKTKLNAWEQEYFLQCSN